MRLSCWPFHSTRTAWGLIVMPRSRSRSIESSTCSRMSRLETVCVSSRMRSARVDFPWSMWAMMEKLRIWAWSVAMRRTRLGRPALGAAAEAAGHQLPDLLGLRHAHQRHGGGKDREAGGDAAQHGDDLRPQGAPERRVEAVPDAVGDEREQHGGAQHLPGHCCRFSAFKPVQLSAREAR